MAYTNIWNTNSPLGSQDAKTADDELRKLRLDLEERLEGTLITDVVADPWVAKPEISGKLDGKVLYLHHGAFSPSFTFDIANSSGVNRTELYTENSTTVGLDLYAPVIIPALCTITNVQFLVNRNGAVNMTCSLRYFNFDGAPVATIVGTVSTVANGVTLISFALTHVVSVSNAYYLRTLLSVGNRVYGAKITYNTPDSRSTV